VPKDVRVESSPRVRMVAVQSVSERGHESFQRMTHEHELEIVSQPVLDCFFVIPAVAHGVNHALSHIHRIINSSRLFS